MSSLFSISWSEIGLIYFSSSLLLLLFYGQTFAIKVFLVSVANLCCLPYIIFSIYYQWRVVKQWCRLCLLVVSILIAEAIWCIFNFWSAPIIAYSSNSTILAVLLCLLLPITAVRILKPLMIDRAEYRAKSTTATRFKNNPAIFQSLLTQQAKVHDGWQQLGIDIGNPYATNTIIKVCNPFCGPCAKAHPILEEIISANKNIRLKVIFTTRNRKTDIGTKIVKHMLAISAEGDPERTRRALDQWYTDKTKNHNQFFEKFPLKKNVSELQVEDNISAMNKWCTDTGIRYTPTIFINSYLLPDNYEIDDLQYIL